jgi:hypothetical protein
VVDCFSGLTWRCRGWPDSARAAVKRFSSLAKSEVPELARLGGGVCSNGNILMEDRPRTSSRMRPHHRLAESRISSTRSSNSSSRWSLRLAAAASATAAAVLALAVVIPVASADGTTTVDASSPSITSRISAADPLNGGFLLVNMQGMLFHPDVSDIQEDLAYARWLGGGIIRVFATDSSSERKWDGTRVGMRIAEIAPMLRSANLRLIVAFVNNHQPVPNEAAGSEGWLDGYMQLLLPFYTTTWRGAYLEFVDDLVTTVQSQNAQDVIFAWELGNELHTPGEPGALVPFVTQAAQEVRALDPVTPILPGSMGANHVQPGDQHSPIARWLYCDAPVDAYTLHAYDWVGRQQPGDMPIDWDLDNIVSEPCPNGRSLPVIIEELGTSRALAGAYTAQDERGRLQQELSQIEFVRHFPRVVGFGVWNGESPRVVDRTFVDTRRGLTSYGSNAQGGGSCYDPAPDPTPGVRCQLEQELRGSTFLRVDASNEWVPGADVYQEASNPVVGSVDPIYDGGTGADSLLITGWVRDPSADDSPGVDGLSLFVGQDVDYAAPVAHAQLGLARTGVPPDPDNPADASNAGFSIRLPLGDVPAGTSLLTLAAHTPDNGTWLRTLHVVVPNLGPMPALRPVAQMSAAPQPIPKTRLRAEIQAPQPGDQVPRSFVMQVLAPDADRVDVYAEPDRDAGGRLIGSASQTLGGSLKLNVNVPLSARTLYVHVSSTTLGQEAVLTLPVVVRS